MRWEILLHISEKQHELKYDWQFHLLEGICVLRFLLQIFRRIEVILPWWIFVSITLLAPCNSVSESPWWFSSKESACQCRRRKINPWVGKIPWKRKWQPTPVFLPGKSHGWKSLVSYSPLGCKKFIHDLATTNNNKSCFYIHEKCGYNFPF